MTFIQPHKAPPLIRQNENQNSVSHPSSHKPIHQSLLATGSISSTGVLASGICHFSFLGTFHFFHGLSCLCGTGRWHPKRRQLKPSHASFLDLFFSFPTTGGSQTPTGAIPVSNDNSNQYISSTSSTAYSTFIVVPATPPYLRNGSVDQASNSLTLSANLDASSCIRNTGKP